MYFKSYFSTFVGVVKHKETHIVLKNEIVRTSFDLDPTQEWIQAHVAQTMNL